MTREAVEQLKTCTQGPACLHNLGPEAWLYVLDFIVGSTSILLVIALVTTAALLDARPTKRARLFLLGLATLSITITLWDLARYRPPERIVPHQAHPRDD